MDDDLKELDKSVEESCSQAIVTIQKLLADGNTVEAKAVIDRLYDFAYANLRNKNPELFKEIEKLQEYIKSMDAKRSI